MQDLWMQGLGHSVSHISMKLTLISLRSHVKLCDRSFWNLSGWVTFLFFFFLLKKKKLLIHLSRVLVVACRILNAAHELLITACVSSFLSSDWTNARWSHSPWTTREVPGYFSFAKWLLTYGLSRFFSFCIFLQLFSVFFFFCFAFGFLKGRFIPICEFFFSQFEQLIRDNI